MLQHLSYTPLFLRPPALLRSLRAHHDAHHDAHPHHHHHHPHYHHPSFPLPRARPTALRRAPTMLRVRKKRRPEDWDKKMSSLSGRFLPMDPREETVLDVLESEARGARPAQPRVEAFSTRATQLPDAWSRRSDAARKRWADPAYRANMLAKRAEKRRRDDAQGGTGKVNHKVEIGRMDSVTLCDDEKARRINEYARSNKRRSEKVTAFHRDRILWMENRLRGSPSRLTDEEYVERKKAIQKRRRSSALRREEGRRKEDACVSREERDGVGEEVNGTEGGRRRGRETGG